MKKWYDEEFEWEIEVIGFNTDNDEALLISAETANTARL